MQQMVQDSVIEYIYSQSRGLLNVERVYGVVIRNADYVKVNASTRC
jgi:hypothetical protein